MQLSSGSSGGNLQGNPHSSKIATEMENNTADYPSVHISPPPTESSVNAQLKKYVTMPGASTVPRSNTHPLKRLFGDCITVVLSLSYDELSSDKQILLTLPLPIISIKHKIFLARPFGRSLYISYQIESKCIS